MIDYSNDGYLQLTVSFRVKQGDLAGPVLFATALEALNIAWSQFTDGLLDFWYADDGELLGRRDSVGTAFKARIQHLLDIGLVLNRLISAFWEHTQAGVDLIKGVPSRTIKTSTEALIVLGYPVVSYTEALKSFSNIPIGKVKRCLEPLENLYHA